MDDAAYSTEAECFLCPEFRGERYSPLVFRQPAPGMLTVSAPWSKHGLLPYGSVTAVFELPTQARELVAVVGGADLDLPTEDALAACFGSSWWKRLAWVVVPSEQASAGLRSWVRTFPEARVVAPEGLGYVTFGLRVGYTFAAHSTPTLPASLAEHVALLPFRTSATTVELAVFHRASGTLYEAGLLLNLPATEAFSKVGRPWLTGLLVRSYRPGGWLQRRKVRSFARSKAGRARVKQDASAIAALPLARIVPSHGDIIDSDTQAVWCAVFGVDPPVPPQYEKTPSSPTLSSSPSSASSVAKRAA